MAQVTKVGNRFHKVKLFPLSLSSTAFNWFTSLAPNSITTWACLSKNFMITFIVVRLSLGYHSLLQLGRNTMNLFLSTLEGLEKVGTNVIV